MRPFALHRLHGVVAEIEDHLLQLGRLARDDRGYLRLADHELDAVRQRDIQERGRLGDQGMRIERPWPRIAAASKGQDLVHQVARALGAARGST